MNYFKWFFNGLLPVLLCAHVEAMFSKRTREYKDRDPEKRFRCNIGELFMDSTISAARAASIFEDAELAGTKHVAGLQIKGSRKHNHSHRDLMQKLTKRSQWAPLYYAPIRVWDKKKQLEVTVQCPFMLPHEQVWAFVQKTKSMICLVQQACPASAWLISKK